MTTNVRIHEYYSKFHSGYISLNQFMHIVTRALTLRTMYI